MSRRSRRELERIVDRIVDERTDRSPVIVFEDATGRQFVNGVDVTSEITNGTFDRDVLLMVGARSQWTHEIDPDTLEVVGRKPLTADATAEEIAMNDTKRAIDETLGVNPPPEIERPLAWIDGTSDETIEARTRATPRRRRPRFLDSYERRHRSPQLRVGYVRGLRGSRPTKSGAGDVNDDRTAEFDGHDQVLRATEFGQNELIPSPGERDKW